MQNIYNPSRTSRILFFLIIASLFLVSVITFIYYLNEKDNVIKIKSTELNSSGKLLHDKVLNWYNERLAEAYFFINNEYFHTYLQNYINSSDKEDSLKIINNFRSIQDNHDYRGIAFIANNKLLLNFNQNFKPDSVEIKAALKSLQEKKINTTSILKNQLTGELYLDIYTPIHYKGKPLGVIILNIDPSQFLYKIFQSFATITSSRESFIISKEQDSIIFISPLKLKEENVIGSKVYSNETGRITSAAAAEYEGSLTGNDYRNVEVLADIRKIKELNWSLIVKQDVSELYQPLKKNVIIFALIGILIISLTGFIILYFHNNQINENIRQIISTEKKYTEVVEQASEGIIIINENLQFLEANLTSLNLTGYTSEEINNLSTKDIFSGEELKEINNKILNKERIFSEKSIKRKNDYTFLAEVSGNTLSSGNYLLFIRDISKRKKDEDELKLALEKAQEMNRLKTSFLTNMSHEIRTPMVGILGFTEILEHEIKDDNCLSMVKGISQGANRLMETLNLILDLSRIEANKMDMKRVDINISEVIFDEVKLMAGTAQLNKIELSIFVKDKNLIINVDRRMLAGIFSNLLNNALKFTDEGGKISVYLTRQSFNEKDFAEIIIEDTGIGISKENQKYIFDAFRQVSEGFNRSFEGTGLGLTITKKFVELMDGNIYLESQPGKGTKFIIHFPVVNQVPETLESKEIEKGSVNVMKSNDKILLVENDKSNITVIKYYLKNVNNLVIAETGEEAIDIAHNQNLCLVLMDINLGKGLDGLQVANRIREIAGYENLPIIAITAFAMEGDREKFISAGCTDYLPKPFKRAELIQIINKYLIS